jgi:ligand-binding SRPBCC domain-containing protein
MTEHLLRREQVLARSAADVFPFFADAGNLARITPPDLSFEFLSELPIAMRVGALIDYRLRLYGVPFRWRTRITGWDPPHAFVDEQIRGPYRRWQHSHLFRAAPDGSGDTLMVDEVRYALPLAPFGEIAHFLVRRKLDAIFDFRREVVGALFGAATRVPATRPADVSSPTAQSVM